MPSVQQSVKDQSRGQAGSVSMPVIPKANADDVIWFCENVCFVPEGMKMGQPIKLTPWQKSAIRKIYNNKHGTRRAILSFGRKNGKTTLAALLTLAHLCGPKCRPNSQLYSTAQSRDQASLIFRLCVKIIQMSPELRGNVQVKETSKELICPELGTRYRALSAEASTAFGLSPSFIVHDELGQICPRKQIKPLQNMGFQTAT